MVSRRAPRRPARRATKVVDYQSDSYSSNADDDSLTGSEDSFNSEDARSSSQTGHHGVALPTDAITPTTFSLALEGLNTGVPTRTTPTLTPTTLRNIEQTFFELQSVAAPPVVHHNQAGFVPPVVNTTLAHSSHTQGQSQAQSGQHHLQPGTFVSVDSKGWQGGSAIVNTSGGSSRSGSVLSSIATSIPTVTTTGRRSMGGRRPAHNDKLTPEEDERRRIRRERNKLAAARCRKRRMDHTNCLLAETEEEEMRKKQLQEEIQMLQTQKEELMFVLEAHRTICNVFREDGDKAVRIKTEMPDPETEGMMHNDHHIPVCVAPSHHHSGSSGKVPTSGASMDQANSHPQHNKPLRPTSLPVAQSFSAQLKVNTKVTEVAGVPIRTPSSGIFNFESLMDGGTGLTPVSVSGTGLTPHLISAVSCTSSGGTNTFVPSCSSQQRSSGGADLSSPDSVPPKLVSL